MHAPGLQLLHARRASTRFLLAESIRRLRAAAREALGLAVVATSVGSYVLVLNWVAGLAGGT